MGAPLGHRQTFREQYLILVPYHDPMHLHLYLTSYVVQGITCRFARVPPSVEQVAPVVTYPLQIVSFP